VWHARHHSIRQCHHRCRRRRLDILCCGQHRHLSRCATASLVAPPPLSLNAPSPLSLRRCLYRHANTCLIAPLSRQRLIVTLSPLLPCQCLSCRAGTSLVAPPPLSMRESPTILHYLTLLLYYTLIHYCTLSFFHCRRETIFWIMWKLIDFTTLNQERRKTRKLLISCLVQKNLFSFANYKKPNQERRNRREASAKASHPS
jgi:hypothetical protein